MDKVGGSYKIVAENSDRLLLVGAGNSRKGNPICTLVEYVLWKMIDGVWTQVIKQVKECSAPENNDGISDYQNSGFPKAMGVLPNKGANPICTLVEYVIYKMIDGVWTEVIKKYKECHSDIDTDPNIHAGSGSTYHNGQGGSSDFDVNKLRN